MRLLWGLARFVIVLLVAVPVFFLVFNRANRLAPVWEASSGQPVPGDFRYLMFPAEPGRAILRNKATGAMRALERAVANTQEEVIAGGIVHVNGPGGQDLEVSISELSYLPPVDSKADYVSRWQDDLRMRGGAQRAGEYRVNAADGGRRLVQLRFIEAMEEKRFEYTTDGATAVPLATWTESLASGRDLGAFALASLAMLGVGTVMLAVTGRVFRWGRAKPAGNQA